MILKQQNASKRQCIEHSISKRHCISLVQTDVRARIVFVDGQVPSILAVLYHAHLRVCARAMHLAARTSKNICSFAHMLRGSCFTQSVLLFIECLLQAFTLVKVTNTFIGDLIDCTERCSRLHAMHFSLCNSACSVRENDTENCSVYLSHILFYSRLRW